MTTIHDRFFHHPSGPHESWPTPLTFRPCCLPTKQNAPRICAENSFTRRYNELSELEKWPRKSLLVSSKHTVPDLLLWLIQSNEFRGAFVASETGDIEFMWIRDSVVQMSTYLNHHMDKPWLRFLVEGAIRRNAFNILQDPYANAYYHEWKNPDELSLKDRVIGRGGFVATRNYELDSGAYFLIHLYDYYMAEDIYRPEALLGEPMIFEAVLLMIETWIVEQHHEKQSPYRYFELSREGLGTKTGYTGMTWTGFRPSDDACKFGYLVPANIHAAAALERILILNDRIWMHKDLGAKASKLLSEIEEGIKKFGIVVDQHGNQVYAYEVDGLGGVLSSFDDANIPSLLSIPLLGWSGYDHQIYFATRKEILSRENTHYFEGSKLKGIGSPHTPTKYVWPMALVVQGLTEEGIGRAEKMAFQMKQLLLATCKDAMHESNDVDSVCHFTRTWFEWVSPAWPFSSFVIKSFLEPLMSLFWLFRRTLCSSCTQKQRWV